ncbi:MAG: DtxR family transcriptional regulator [Victivallaceae bacterium]|nr:metal-dependent transcriptional regulator [Victivallaceae bacterium]
MAQIGITGTMEDYLETISEIAEAKGHAHAKDIADKLKVRMSSVSAALQALSARGLVIFHTGAAIKLTRDGEVAALEVRRRHKLLLDFFSEVLKLDFAEANDNACKVEHVISMTAMERIAALTDMMAAETAAAPLRELLAERMPKIVPEKTPELISLDNLAEGDRAVIAHVAANLRGLRRFADLGLVPGTPLELEGHAPFGDLLRVRVLGSSLSIRSGDAAYIWVKPLE